MSLYASERPEFVPTDLITLTQMPVVVSRVVSDEFLEELPSETYAQVTRDVFEGLCFQLRSYVYAEHLAEERIPVNFSRTATFSMPASWWQHLKQEHGPKWLRRRWPVRMKHLRQTLTQTKHVRVQQFAAFPASPIKTPPKYRGQHVVRVERTAVDS